MRKSSIVLSFSIFMLSYLPFSQESSKNYDSLLNGYKALQADIEHKEMTSKNDIENFNSQIKMLLKKEAARAVAYLKNYAEQIDKYFMTIIQNEKFEKNVGPHCKDKYSTLLSENLQTADENVTICLALGYQRVQKLPDKLNPHFETIENLRKYTTIKTTECQKQKTNFGNCTVENLDLERTVFLYESSPFPIVMAEVTTQSYREIIELSICLKEITTIIFSVAVKVIGEFNNCINNIDTKKLKTLLKLMKNEAK